MPAKYFKVQATLEKLSLALQSKVGLLSARGATKPRAWLRRWQRRSRLLAARAALFPPSRVRGGSSCRVAALLWYPARSLAISGNRRASGVFLRCLPCFCRCLAPKCRVSLLRGTWSRPLAPLEETEAPRSGEPLGVSVRPGSVSLGAWASLEENHGRQRPQPQPPPASRGGGLRVGPRAGQRAQSLGVFHTVLDLPHVTFECPKPLACRLDRVAHCVMS